MSDTTPAATPTPFSPAEVQAFHAEEQHAGRIIICLLTGIFSTGLAMYLVIAYICS